jgi:hypothetical protein
MRQLGINNGPHQAPSRGRRYDDVPVQLAGYHVREKAFQLVDPCDPDIAKTNQLQKAAARRRPHSASEGETT